MMTKRFISAGLAVFALGFAIPAQAVQITLAAFDGSENVLDFTFPNGTVVTNQYAGLGATLEGHNQVFDNGLVITPAGMFGSPGAETITFSTLVHKVGVDFINMGGSPVVLEVYNGMALLETVQFIGSGSVFLGIDSGGVPITKAVVHDSGFTFQIDNVRFGAYGPLGVPEGGTTVAFLGMALFGLQGARRWFRPIGS
jgi:hypothetical protein